MPKELEAHQDRAKPADCRRGLPAIPTNLTETAEFGKFFQQIQVSPIMLTLLKVLYQGLFQS